MAATRTRTARGAARGADRGADRGQHAGRPAGIPGRGWRDILTRVKGEASRDNVGLIAGGVAFFALLAIFPAIAAAVSIYGLVMNPETVQSQIQALGGMVPEAAMSIIERQLSSVASASSSQLGLVAA